MQYKHCFKIMHRLLCYLWKIDETNEPLFDDVFVFLIKNFAQILLIIMNENWIQMMKTFLQKNYLWSRLKLLQLTENIRVHSSTINECFTNWIKRLFYNDNLIGLNKITSFKYVEIIDSLFSLTIIIYFVAIIENAVCDWIHFTDQTIFASLNDIV